MKKCFPQYLLMPTLILLLVNIETRVFGQSKKPNIVFIMADDLGVGDIEPYGQSIFETPNLSRLAQEGIMFKDFYAGSTVCAPSRASLMTGQHTGKIRIRGNGEFPLDPDVKILPEMLKENGYTNLMFGKWGLGLQESESSPEKRGWDFFLGHLHHVSAHFQKPDSLDLFLNNTLGRVKVPEGTYANDWFTEGAINYIETSSNEEPFFIYLSYTIPHAELLVPDRYFKDFVNENGQSVFPNEIAWPDGKHYGQQNYPKAAYAALVHSLDDYVGQVMDALESKGIADNTILIFTSDNGTHIEGGRRMEDVDYFQSSGQYRGVKRDLYDGGIKVPLIIKWPDKIKQNSVTEHRASFWDVYNTFGDIVGNIDSTRDGISFLPTLLGKSKQKQHEYLYWEFHEFGGKQALLKGDWKIIRLEVGNNPANKVELYNVKKDPAEQIDLADKFTKRAARLTRIMDNVRTSSSLFNFGKK
ncbi:arylsulfatase A family protein [Belliella baltica DSM 15883]|uniref:Arylsulfatase A family protein n=1 Tax=Belliella baltica (strain DSM 15883 / CIP 108006 / LMG 21964 / BA134) TaxID=866536 RepID=I3Z962_BELBD|nr:arylsulfatase [Belliella baltica]AFL85780.1 arylsulfatase A family protein [Belliella baltica DSM 15883]